MFELRYLNKGVGGKKISARLQFKTEGFARKWSPILHAMPQL